MRTYTHAKEGTIGVSGFSVSVQPGRKQHVHGKRKQHVHGKISNEMFLVSMRCAYMLSYVTRSVCFEKSRPNNSRTGRYIYIGICTYI